MWDYFSPICVSLKELGSWLCYADDPFGGRHMAWADLERVAAAMVAPDKGILAADESTGTVKKRFDKIRLESTPESRRAYRELLFTTPGMAKSISGVIFYDETLRQ